MGALINSNIEMLEIVARGLGTLLNEVVFVGGTTTILYVDSDAAPEPRPTEDVDCIIELASHQSNLDLEDKLRSMGFVNDMKPGAPVCRWLYSGITIEILLRQ